MRKIRALLVDDEPIANEGMHAMLRRHPDVHVIGECLDAASAVNQIRQLSPDVVFMDIHMPGMDGFGAVNAVDQKCLPIIVFVTAHDEYALRAFDVNTTDYLLKPVADSKLDRAMDRIRRQLTFAAKANNYSEGDSAVTAERQVATDSTKALTGNSRSATLPANTYFSRVCVRSGRRSIVIAVNDIDWIAADDYCVGLMVKGRRHLLRASLTSLELRLDPSVFVRVHRSAIVNVTRVTEWRTDALRRLVLILADGSRLRVSRSRRAKLLMRLIDNASCH